jgi:ubiquinone biosynthesis protein UbiJ
MSDADTASADPISPPPWPMPPHPLDALPVAINHLLAAEPWARAQLAPHANKTLDIVVKPFTIRLSVAPDGTVARAAASSGADTVVTLPFSAFARALSGARDAVLRDMQLEGDAEFAQAVSLVARNLRWDAEEDLSKFVGDAVAHRVVRAARAVGSEVVRANEKIVANVGEYLLDENPQLVRPHAVETLAAGIRRLRDDLARLEKRIDRVTERATERPTPGPRA